MSKYFQTIRSSTYLYKSIEGRRRFSYVFSFSTKTVFLSQNPSHFLPIPPKKLFSLLGTQFYRHKSSDTFQHYANMSSKHLATGSKLPPPQDGILRIYSMRFCPYAQRVLLVADAKKIPHDVVNANLKQKPEWLLERNPSGKVPVIDTENGSLYESLVISDYLDEVYSSHQLNSPDPFQKALDRIWVENFTKVISLYYKVLFNHKEFEVAQGHFKELTEVLATFEKELERRGALFYGGKNQPGMLDYMIWPWVERLPVIKLVLPTLQDFEALRKDLPRFDEWRQAMNEDSAVKTNFLTPEIHLQFIQSFVAKDPNYDILEN